MSAVAAGDAVIDLTDHTVAERESDEEEKSKSSSLSENELAVLEQLARGKTPAEIAADMTLTRSSTDRSSTDIE